MIIEKAGFFFLKKDGKFHRLEVADILWLYSEGNYCYLVLDDNQKYKIKYSLAKLVSVFRENKIIRTHKSYAVNMDKVAIYDPKGTIIINNQEIPLSRLYRQSFEQNLNLLKP